MLRAQHEQAVTKHADKQLQEAVAGKGVSELRWEHFPLNPSAPSLTQELLRADPSFVKLRDLLRSLSGGNTDSRLRELYGVDSAELLRRAADSGRDRLF